MGKRKKRSQYTAQTFIEAIPGTGGIITSIAQKVGCHWDTAAKYIREYPSVRQAYENERNSIVDMAETVLIKSIKQGNTQDAKWYLERKRKDEYSLRRELKIERQAIEAMTDDELDDFIDSFS